MLGRLIGIVFFILFLWAIGMYFIWKDRIRNPYTIQANSVALTFDDGPTIPYTQQILGILKQHQVNATFFVLGKNAAQHPELLRQAYEEGNAIACHGMEHLDLTKATQKQLEAEVLGCKETVKKIIGKFPICYRPAFNKITPEAQKYIESQNMVVIRVGIDSSDWNSSDVQAIVKRTLSLIEPQQNIGLHDGAEPGENRSATVSVLPILIKDIKEKMGLKFSRICYP